MNYNADSQQPTSEKPFLPLAQFLKIIEQKEPEESDVTRSGDPIYPIYEGSINSNGEKHGYGKKSYGDADECYILGEWKNNECVNNAIGKIRLTDSAIYEGPLFDCKPHGLGTLTLIDANKRRYLISAAWHFEKDEPTYIYTNELLSIIGNYLKLLEAELVHIVGLAAQGYLPMVETVTELFKLQDMTTSEIVNAISQNPQIPLNLKSLAKKIKKITDLLDENKAYCPFKIELLDEPIKEILKNAVEDYSRKYFESLKKACISKDNDQSKAINNYLQSLDNNELPKTSILYFNKSDIDLLLSLDDKDGLLIKLWDQLKSRANEQEFSKPILQEFCYLYQRDTSQIRKNYLNDDTMNHLNSAVNAIIGLTELNNIALYKAKYIALLNTCLSSSSNKEQGIIKNWYEKYINKFNFKECLFPQLELIISLLSRLNSLDKNQPQHKLIHLQVELITQFIKAEKNNDLIIKLVELLVEQQLLIFEIQEILIKVKQNENEAKRLINDLMKISTRILSSLMASVSNDITIVKQLNESFQYIEGLEPSDLIDCFNIFKELVDLVKKLPEGISSRMQAELLLAIGKSLKYFKNKTAYQQDKVEDKFEYDFVQPFVQAVEKFKTYYPKFSKEVASIDIGSVTSKKTSNTAASNSTHKDYYTEFDRLYDSFFIRNDEKSINEYKNNFISSEIINKSEAKDNRQVDLARLSFALSLQKTADSSLLVIFGNRIPYRNHLYELNDKQIAALLPLLDKPDNDPQQRKLIQTTETQDKTFILGLLALYYAYFHKKKVLVTCYAKEIENDFKDLEALFGAFFIQVAGPEDDSDKQQEAHIWYDTFENIAKKSVLDLENDVKALILDNKPSASPLAVSSNGKDTVLLVDDINALFADDLYRNFYNPVVFLEQKNLAVVQQGIWKEVNQQKGYSEVLDKVKTIPLSPSLPPLLFQKFIDKNLEYMIRDAFFIAKPNGLVSLVDQGSRIEFRLSKNKKTVEAVRLNDHKSLNVSYGYKNLFAGFKLNEEERTIDFTTIPTYSKLFIQAGYISFVELLAQYSTILGFSQVIKKKIDNNDFSPSPTKFTPLFTKEEITFFPAYTSENENSPRTVSIELFRFFRDDLNFLNDVLRVVKDAAKQGRSVLIFFEDYQFLEQFHIKYPRSRILSSITEPKNDLIDEAGSQEPSTGFGRVTLCDRFYSCTNFKTTPKVARSGGMYVIQTFLSLDPTEEAQIQNRAVSNGEKGSYQLILRQRDIEKIFSKDENTRKQEDDKIKSLNGNALYEPIHELRLKKYNNLAETTNQNKLKSLNDRYDKTTSLRSWFSLWKNTAESDGKKKEARTKALEIIKGFNNIG